MSATASDAAAPAAAASSPAAATAAPLTKSQKQAAKQAALLARSQAMLPSSAPWTIDVLKSCGRRGLASAPIAAGTTIVDEQGAGWIIRAEMAHEWCAHCCKPVVAAAAGAKICAGKCGWAYCSAECASLSAPLHQFVCPLLPSLPALAGESSVEQDMLTLVVTLIAGLAMDQQQQQRGVDAAAAAGSASASSSPAPAQVSRGRWQDAADLVSHLDRAEPAWLHVIEHAMKLLIERYRALQSAPDSVFARLRVPDAQTLVSLCSRINSNAHGIFDNYSSSNSTIGLGLFPLTSILNHSCAPNAAFSPAAGGRMIVRTLRAIEAGEEICVPYVDLLQSRSERQRELLTDKHFICACQRCRMEEKAKLSWPLPAAAGEAALALQSVQPVAVPSGVHASVECAVSAAQLWSWLLLGAVQCPACKKPQQQTPAAAAAPPTPAAAAAAVLESDAWLDEDESKKLGIKKKKKKAPAAAAATAASSSSSAASAAAPSAESLVAASGSASTLDLVAARSAREPSFSLLIWRGSPDELRTKAAAPVAPDSAAAAAPAQPKSWHCSRVAGHRFTGAEAEAALSSLPLVFRRISALRAGGQFAEALRLYEGLLSQVGSELATPGHALALTVHVNIFNLCRQLARGAGATASASAASLGRAVAAGLSVLALMEDSTPAGSASLEQSDFCVAVATTMLESLEAGSKADAHRPAKLAQARQLLQRAYDLRAIGCGVNHPRTVATTVPAAWANEVSIRRRDYESGEGWPIALPKHWQQTAVTPPHEAAVAAALAAHAATLSLQSKSS